MKRWMALAFGDWRNIRRDWVLLITLAAPLFLLLFVRFGIPPLDAFLQNAFDFSLQPYRDRMMGILILVPGQTIGMMAGLLLLDDRDEGILEYISVTPVSKAGYLVCRMSLAVTLCFALTMLFAALSGWADGPALGLVPAVAAASLEVPLYALFLAAFSGNKVEGLALSKLAGLSFLGPLAAWCLPGEWKWTGAAVPAFWVFQTHVAWMERSPGFMWWSAGSLTIHVIWICLLVRIFRRRAG